MSFLKKHRTKILAVAAVAIILAFAFWWGGDAPGSRGRKPEPSPTVLAAAEKMAPKETAEPTAAPTPEPSEKPSELPVKKPQETAAAENRPERTDEKPMTAEEKLAAAERMAQGQIYVIEAGDPGYSEANGMELEEDTGKDRYQTDPIPEGRPLPMEPQDAVITDTELTCTLSVRCDTILDNLAWLDPEKTELVPKDGVIFAEQEVTFYEGESVFNLLLREMKKNKIHMEFVNTPIYNSAYIEGIHNLYEHDCGELSGWMYKVNGWFPNYGCSRYRLQAGDRVEWVYTCDLGIDVGGYYAAGGE